MAKTRVTRTDTDRCPECGGELYKLERSWFCPTESPHSGGAVFVMGEAGFVRLRRTEPPKKKTRVVRLETA